MPKRGIIGAARFIYCILAFCVAFVAGWAKGASVVQPKADHSKGILVTAPKAAHAAAPLPLCKTNLTRQLRTLDVPGLAASIVKNGGVVCVAAAGLANIEQNKAVTPDTLFLIASVSKTITGTALMQLRDQGKFHLDDDINKYLPFKIDIPAAPMSAITFRQLLTHTSSIADNPKYINCPVSCAYGSSLGDFVTKGADSPISLADLTKGYLTPGGAYYDRTANFKASAPGTVFEYSNMGIVVAGYLVQLLSGTSFDRYSMAQIFTPLGMETSSWRLDGLDQSLLAMPYDKSSSGYVPYGHYGEPDYPDGMLRTSVKELGYFLISYIQGGHYSGQRILQSQTVREILKRQSALDRLQGLVWVMQSIDGRTVWGHEGADNGAGAQMWLDPVKSEGVVLMTNGIWKDDDNELLAALFREADRY